MRRKRVEHNDFQTCPKCGELFSVYDDDKHLICMNCDTEGIISDDYESIYYKYGDESVEQTDKRFFDAFMSAIMNKPEPKEEGCIACGCSAYPDCKSSCPLFDD